MRVKEFGEEDPRRVIHSFKVGLALTMVSLFYYFKPLYDGFGVNAIWAVLTVVVVFEFSVGATLGKGLNRMVATFVAGGFGIGAHHLASLSRPTGEPILIAAFVFIIAAVVTFTRFFPKVKARYDYGFNIFILTFSLVSVSGYRDSQVWTMAHERLSTILVGSSTAVIVCVVVYPVWIGEELHNLVVTNIENLGEFLVGFGDAESNNNGKTLGEDHKSVLASKSNEENMVSWMANLARWEPGHGRFRLQHPWKQYLKIGTLARECAYKVDALSSYLNPHVQPVDEMGSRVEAACRELSTECGRVLKELALATRKMKRPKPADAMVASSRAAADNLKLVLDTSKWDRQRLVELVPIAALAAVLLEIAETTERIADAVVELSSKAHFKSADSAVSPEQPSPPPAAALPVSSGGA
ncbi:unnamed protein product [Linum tenue]|uniref:Aluminum-activated malate transporter n=2 Tax=Linum tenue TaxID=586396 RepID=A0AAV0QFK5_9ROSI|nr:unnamed protein product [Linum tenue]